MKHPFALLAPLVFLVLAACDFNGAVGVEFKIDCPLPPPVITDTTLMGSYNGLCAYYWWDGDSTLHFFQPGP